MNNSKMATIFNKSYHRAKLEKQTREGITTSQPLLEGIFMFKVIGVIYVWTDNIGHSKVTGCIQTRELKNCC